MQELEECLNLLVGDANIKTSLPAEMGSDEFAENVLGFEEVEEVEDENGEGFADPNLGAQGASYSGRLASNMIANDVIPEENL